MENQEFNMIQFMVSSNDERVIQFENYLQENKIEGYPVGDNHLALLQEDGVITVVMLGEQNGQEVIFAANFNANNIITGVSKKVVDNENNQEIITDLETGEIIVEPLQQLELEDDKENFQTLASCPRGYEWRLYNCKNVPSFSVIAYTACMAIYRNHRICMIRATTTKRKCQADCFPVVYA